MRDKFFIMPSILDRVYKVGIKTKMRIISLFILLVPVYFFIIGDFYGSGFQTSFFRYQEVFLGSFVILISNDIYNVITGFFNGSMVPAVILWCLGFCFLVVNCILLFVGRKDFNRIIRRGGMLIIISGIFFLLSIIVRYGPLFNNSTGIAIPLGLPLIFLIGIWMFRWVARDQTPANKE
jgi:hypothetical protein